MSPEPEENQMTKGPFVGISRILNHFCCSLICIQRFCQSITSNGNPSRTPPSKPMHRNLVIIYDLLAARALAWDFWTS